MRYWPTWPLLLAALIATIQLLIAWRNDFCYVGDISIPEGAIVYSIRAVTGSDSVYRDFSQPPYCTTPYPPVYYGLSSAVSHCFGSDVESSYRGGRLVTILATVLSFCLLYALALELSSSRLGSLLVVGSATTLTCLIGWSATCRPDMTALMFSLLGLLCAIKPGRFWAVCAVTAFCAAILTKHSFVAAPVSATLWWVLRRDFRRALAIALPTLAVTAVSFLLLDKATSGWFIANVIGANLAPTIATQPLMFLKFFALGSAFPLLIFVSWVVGGRGQCLRHPDVAVIYLIVSLGVASVSSLKAGADINYFIEPGFALALATAGGWPYFQRRMDASFESQLILCFVFMVVMQPTLFHVRWRSLFENRHSETAQALATIGSLPSPVLIGDAALSVRADQPIWILDKFNASYIEEAGTIHCDALVAKIANKEFSAVVSEVPMEATIAGHPWWPKSVQKAILRHYPRQRCAFGRFFYEPRAIGPGTEDVKP